MTAVRLEPVSPGQSALFLAMFDAYCEEMEPFDPLRAGAVADMAGVAEGDERLWVMVEGRRAGFVVLRAYEDDPGPGERTTEVVELYVQPLERRRGVGRAAVEAVLARERERGTALVEAAVLRDNGVALAFWEALGFEVRVLRTARRP